VDLNSSTTTGQRAPQICGILALLIFVIVMRRIGLTIGAFPIPLSLIVLPPAKVSGGAL
jgi:hypothetical protein